jgi:hypothetical protein
MNKGKVTCEKLKAIRREVAEKLGIEYSPKECTFEGDCLGTCPLCQQETDMLMEHVISRMKENPESMKPVIHKLLVMYDCLDEVTQNDPIGGYILPDSDTEDDVNSNQVIEMGEVIEPPTLLGCPSYYDPNEEDNLPF